MPKEEAKREHSPIKMGLKSQSVFARLGSKGKAEKATKSEFQRLGPLTSATADKAERKAIIDDLAEQVKRKMEKGHTKLPSNPLGLHIQCHIALLGMRTEAKMKDLEDRAKAARWISTLFMPVDDKGQPSGFKPFKLGEPALPSAPALDSSAPPLVLPDPSMNPGSMSTSRSLWWASMKRVSAPEESQQLLR